MYPKLAYHTSVSIKLKITHVYVFWLQVKYFCGPAKWNTRAAAVSSEVSKIPESQEVWNGEEEDLSSALLTSKLSKFTDPETVVRVRGLFSNMAQSLCANYTTTDCWNGRTVAEWVYKKFEFNIIQICTFCTL